MDIFTAAMIAEGVQEVETEAECLAAWQHLVDTGTAWKLQGWFGRVARDLLRAGLISAEHDSGEADETHDKPLAKQAGIFYGARDKMAWRPHENLIEGELHNTTPGRVTGWLRFVGVLGRVTLDLVGDFHRDIRGASIRLKNPHPSESHEAATSYMKGFCNFQTGKVGDITAGLPPRDYGTYPYVEWYGENGRVVLELDSTQVEVVGSPLAWEEQEPVSREEQSQNLGEFMLSVAGAVRGKTA